MGGKPVEKLLKLRRLEEDRVHPITVPLSQDILDELIGVQPQDAWLPLSIALINRLQRLWNIISGGPYLIARLTGDEHLYQVMRTSFFNVFQEREDNEVTQKAIRARLPKTLPTTGKLASFTRYSQAKFDDKFESIESLLIGDALRLGIPSDTRTVEDALKDFDAQLDKLELLHHQHALRDSPALDHSNELRDELKRAIRTLQRRMRNGQSTYLAMAVEVVARLRSIWELLYPDTRDLRRYAGDEAAYQAYRNLLLSSLTDPEYGPVHALASDLLPRLLPLSEELDAANIIFAEMPGRFERLRNEIVALAFQLHEPITIDYADEPDLDEVFEEQAWEWTALKKTVGKERSAPDSDKRPASSASLRRGRPATPVTYEIATDAWWHLYNADTKAPTQQHLIDRLTFLGFPISTRTLRNRIAEWQANGQPWPPPEDRSSAA
jgi:hypothetical protein